MSTVAPQIHAELTSKNAHGLSEQDYALAFKIWFSNLRDSLRFRSSPDSVSFLSSLCIHVLLILVLAILGISTHVTPRTLLFSLSDGESALDHSAIDLHFATENTLNADESQSNALMEMPLELLENRSFAPTLETETRKLTTDFILKRSLPSETVAASSISASSAATRKVLHSGLFAGSSLEGRSPGNRRGLAMQNGGNKASEDAVDAALIWFAAHQSVDGSWSTEMTGKPCNGRCSHGTEEIGSPKKIAATGLALLCFLGAGHTHREGLFKDEVYKAIRYLTNTIKKNQRDDRLLGRFLNDDGKYEMYEHGIAVLALCEACEMTKDTSLIEPCTNGIEFIVRAQHPDGSWGYTPNTSGDLSIVGWQMMALKSALKLGIRVQPAVIAKVDKFLDSQQSEYGAYYGYRSTQKDPCATGIGLLLRLYRGWAKTDPRILKGAQYIADLGPSTNGIYYNYYATQLLFHMKHPAWAEWNQTNRDYVVREQAKEGHEKGSWYFGRSHFNQVGGRLYCTAMATLTLEVYYRFMPIYSELSQDDFQL